MQDHRRGVDTSLGLLLVLTGLGLFFGYPHRIGPLRIGDIAVAAVILLIAIWAALAPWLRKTQSGERIGIFVNASIAGTLIILSALHYSL